jgi:hypothetical protein
MNTAQKTKKNHIKTGQQNTPYEDEKSKQALHELTASEIKKATGKHMGYCLLKIGSAILDLI